MLPCPFCGNDAIKIKYTNRGRPFAYCGVCEARGSDYVTVEDAETAWNQRAKPAQQEQSCGNCRFWKDGECQRFPPVPLHNNGLLTRTVFARSEPDDWCGEWQEKQT